MDATNETLKDWANQISQLSEPMLIPDIHSIDLMGKTTVAISIKEYPLKPVAIRGRCYRRVGPSNKVMTPSDISEMHLHSTGGTWDAIPSPKHKLSDIDIERVKNYVQRANSSGRRNFNVREDPVQLLNKLRLVVEGVPTWASIIAFCERPPLQAKVKCGRIRGTSTIVDDYVVDDPILDQVNEVISYMKRTLKLSYEISGNAEHEDIWEYPLDAVREIVTNAICHRDYASPAQIQIKIFDDHISFYNPGKLPLGMSLKRLLDPNHNSIPRNQLIAMIFYDCAIIENYGSGINRILKDCHDHGFPDPEFIKLEGGFQVILHKNVFNEESLRKKGFNDRQVQAVLHVKEYGYITNKDHQELTGVKKRQASDDLKGLEVNCILERVGSTGKGTHYILKGHQRGVKVAEMITNS